MYCASQVGALGAADACPTAAELLAPDKGQWVAAIEDFDCAIERDPESEQLSQSRAPCLFSAKGR